MSSEERERQKREEAQSLEEGRKIGEKYDQFQKGQISDVPQLVSGKNASLQKVAQDNAYPQAHFGIRGLPSNHIMRYNFSLIFTKDSYNVFFKCINVSKTDENFQ